MTARNDPAALKEASDNARSNALCLHSKSSVRKDARVRFSPQGCTKPSPGLAPPCIRTSRSSAILCQITSQSISDRYGVPLGTNDFKMGGLKHSSNIRPNRLFTADERIVSYRAELSKKRSYRKCFKELYKSLQDKDYSSSSKSSSLDFLSRPDPRNQLGTAFRLGPFFVRNMRGGAGRQSLSVLLRARKRFEAPQSFAGIGYMTSGCSDQKRSCKSLSRLSKSRWNRSCSWLS